MTQYDYISFIESFVRAWKGYAEYIQKLTGLRPEDYEACKDVLKVLKSDAFFDCLFSPKWLKDYGKAQDELLKLFEKGRDQIQLKPYVRMLRVAQDSLSVFKPTKALGKKIYICLKGEPIMADVTDGETIQTYYSKQGYGVTMDYSWENPIKLLAAVKQEYKDK